MDIFANLATGFGAAATPINLGFCLFGCLVGTLIGVLPGIGPIATIAMLLPVTFGLPPLGALIMLAGIYYGAQYGGSTTAILVNLPGESSSVVTCIDGYQMARNGRAGAALTIAAVGSFFAGCVGTLLIAAFAPVLAAFAVKFRSPEYFALMLFGLIAAVILAHGSVVKAVGMVLLGLLVGLIGTDIAERDVALHVRRVGALRRRRLRAARHGPVRARRDHEQSRPHPRRAHRHAAHRQPVADARGAPPRGAGGAAGHRARRLSRHPAGRRRGAGRRLPPTRWRRKSRAPRANSAKARSRALRRRRPPTMPAPRPRSFRS